MKGVECRPKGTVCGRGLGTIGHLAVNGATDLAALEEEQTVTSFCNSSFKMAALTWPLFGGSLVLAIASDGPSCREEGRCRERERESGHGSQERLEKTWSKPPPVQSLPLHPPPRIFPILSPFPSFFSSWVPPAITQEDINVFYGVDRRLYTRLVMNLRWDPTRSMQLMAMWVWLGRISPRGSLISLIVELSDPIISVLGDEAAMYLHYLEHENYHHLQKQTFLTQTIMRHPDISLRFFHENRAAITTVVMNIFNHVCLKNLGDIMQEAERLQASNNPHNCSAGHSVNYPGPNNTIHSTDPNPNPNPGVSISSTLATPFSYFCYQFPINGGASSSHFTSPSHRFKTEDHKPSLIDQADPDSSFHGNIYGGIGPDGEVVEGPLPAVIPPDDRTIFLTFSKGYPISEDQVRHFFIRKLGNCFEAIYMQGVSSPSEQPLYARLVVRPDQTIHVVLNGKSKVKFVINGKHLWGRKYLKKTHRSPPAANSPLMGSSPSSPPTLWAGHPSVGILSHPDRSGAHPD
ncbi:hypothetical protein SAY87_007858 [Trapa incisa]|uniref:Uncharacterized protein n=1 Tax=Trapa incisa TaxID=236973 RepID=A0AAN7QFD9_9MYRT|nr:hypothetical protein SAY87_007858 [Trapa incisa]